MTRQEIDSYVHTWVPYWCRELRIKLPTIRRDDRVNYAMVVLSYLNTDDKILEYSSKVMKKSEFDDVEITHAIFHELGHLKEGNKVWSDSLENNEYNAEKFSLKCLKTYKPKYYLETISRWKEWVKSDEFRKASLVHYNAFKKIIDYK